MKHYIIALLLLICLPWQVMAQSNDDLYYVPKKEKKQTKDQKVTVKSEVKQTQVKTVSVSPSSTVVVEDVSGKVRDIDEYNRRSVTSQTTYTLPSDTLYVDEQISDRQGEWVNGFDGTSSDYEYAMRLIRFRNPAYAIPVGSALYWDVVYGTYPSWYWNIYDDGFYAYVFPTYSNPLWWDWRWNWSISGPYWSIGWNWAPSWYYAGWHSPHWYGGYWGGYWAGYYSRPWHHHGWAAAGWHRPGRTDYRSSRYRNYTSSLRGNESSSRRGYTRTVGSASSSRNTSSSIGRVVRPSSTGINSNAVRPGRTITGGSSNRRAGLSSGNTSRGSINNYVRPSSTVNRTGSSYNRPSSTRRSVLSPSKTNTRQNFNTIPRSSGSQRTTVTGGGSSRRFSTGGGGRSGGGSSVRRR